ncbi:FG-GAP repeat domain-containing protein [Streptomyces sp. NBC_00829]|uniref:FG-GAP repeat domain-containing protein n=1 Tax=Streptomyces sp. NBC_00829 TaxID=2903679 RepID=UPI0038690AB6|nr:VCBS repeat-containing protein [Streptomyces sp. NBC_00829]
MRGLLKRHSVRQGVPQRGGARLGAVGGAVAMVAAGLVGLTGGVATAAAPEGSPITLETPDVQPGGKVTHTVTVHAAEAGQLTVAFKPSQEQRWWDLNEEWTLGIQASGTDARCRYPATIVSETVSCELPPGDHTISYSVSANTDAQAWKIDVSASFTGSTEAANSAFTAAVGNRAPAMDYWLLGRDKTGTLWSHSFSYGELGPLDIEWRSRVSTAFDQYDLLTKTAPITVRGKGGDVLTRDSSGHLWFHPTLPGEVMKLGKPVDVGSGWGQYTSVRGAGDLSGDGEPDLIARGSDGTLWLYKGTGNDAAPLTARTKIGTGWNIYGSLTGGVDLTGDDNADLLARDSSGGLWLYEGTGSAAAPLKARMKVGSGWNIYNALVAYGDVGGDGHADLIARDTAGVMWLYEGTGNAALPFGARVKVNRYWEGYDAVM